MIRPLLGAVAALSWTLGATASIAATPCVTPPEAESITLVAMPEIIRQVGQICTPILPPTSLVRQTQGAFITKYQVQADRSWPDAKAALARIAGPQIAPLLQSDFTRPLLTSLLAPALIGAVDPRDCSQIDRIVTLMAPLPARNAAGLIVSVLQLVKEKQAEFGTADKTQTLDIPICPVDRH